MRNKLAILLITSLFLTYPARADFYSGLDGSDFTGESYFLSPSSEVKPADSTEEKGYSTKRSIPPVKLLRLKAQEFYNSKKYNPAKYAPTADISENKGEIETSEYASHEETEAFEDMSPDGFEADEQALEENVTKSLFKKKKKKAVKAENTEDIILDCDVVDYDTPNYMVYARGNVSVEFVKQQTVVKADVITFDRANNTIKAEGNVKIIKNDNIVTGDYIFVDLNEENALIENPMTETPNIVMKAKRGYVYSDKIVQEQGSINVDASYPIELYTSGEAGIQNMLLPKNQTISHDMEKGIVKFTAKDIKVTQKGDLETIAIKKGKLAKGSRTIFKVPAVKIYTNKNHEYVESNIWEVGSYRGLGVYTGPGWVFELPKGSVLKAMPILTLKSGIGVGAMGRFSSGTNKTLAAYGSSEGKVIVYGKQKLDDNLFLQYGVNGYMDEWFLGRRRPKYGVSIVYDKGYSSRDFILKDRTSTFEHRFEGGYFQDLDYDKGFERIDGGGHIGTTRFRYMAAARQNFYEWQNEEKLTAFTFGVASQMSAALYGTGDTQVIGRIGPLVHTQYKRWMQDIGYYFSVYDDNTPMPVFDAYRFGKQNLYMREYFRICRWMTISWLGSFNLSNDSPNHRSIQGNAFFISVGPDDLKFNIGFDLVRQALQCSVDVMMDAKGTNIEYDKLEIKQTKKPSKAKEPVVAKTAPANTAPTAPTAPAVLQKAVVENVKVMEEVL